MPTKIVAYYLPQFHRIPENDAWWGEGFTEWTNTRKMKPMFRGHQQPREPLDDNYYDLSDPAVYRWQTRLARQHGIDAFCFYHYWFGPHRLLEGPFNRVLAHPDMDFPFCLAWANEPWTKAWDGGENEILMPQLYGEKTQWAHHYEFLRNAFNDPRYLTLEGAPVFLIYRPHHHPCIRAMLEFWQELAAKERFKRIALVQMLTSRTLSRFGAPIQRHVAFEPMATAFFDLPMHFRVVRRAKKVLRRGERRLGMRIPALLGTTPYEMLWKRILRRPALADTFPGAFVDWDNSSRRGANAMICTGANPATFQRYFSAQLARANQAGSELLFINAWNEWAEGAYLEPDVRNGYGYLRAIQAAVAAQNAVRS